MEPNAVATAATSEWQPMETAPLGAKCLMLTNRGIAVIVAGPSLASYRAWAPLPKRADWMREGPQGEAHALPALAADDMADYLRQHATSQRPHVRAALEQIAAELDGRAHDITRLSDIVQAEINKD